MGAPDGIKRAARDQSGHLSLAGSKLKKLPKSKYFVAEKLDPTTIRTLTLSNNAIAKITDETAMTMLAEMTKVESLNLFGNHLKHLPSNLSVLSHLELLIVSNNRLVDLPAGFGGCPRLRVLDLSANQLKELRPQLCQLTTLRELHLSDNKLTELPVDIGQLQELQVLGLRNNRLTALPASLAQLKALRKLLLQNNKLKSLPKYFAECTNITALELYGNPMHPCIIDAFASGVQYLQAFIQRADYEQQLATKGKRSRLTRARSG
ncbi:hypothetical protein BC828DRAFT_392618 [Blastocladiella britannica]|nr:hypothetical protein BC828DRAFT_392618 [Blastocladiella britannica]